ncbi:MAG: biotin--[acetyl-CoA-carboxylase] ligase [Acidobacteriota bacterium]
MNIGTIIHSLSTCASTNDLAKRLAQEGAVEGTVVTAEEQTKGRGTKGRSWHAPRGQGLYLSVILRPRRSDLSLLPLVAGIACAEAIREVSGIAVRLKWPNDVVWNGRKLGGILCESEFVGNRVKFAVLGIGLNLDQKPGDFPPDLRKTATSLRIAMRRGADREKLKRGLFAALDRWYSAFCRGRKGEIVRAYEAHLIIPKGKLIKVAKEKEKMTGTFCGIDSRARLVLKKDGRDILLFPAEILSIDYND